MATFSSLPKGWEVMKLYGCFTESTAKNSSLSFTRAMQFNYGRIVDKNESFETDEVKDIYAKYSLVKKGDIVINGLNLNYDVVSQRVAIVPKDGIITSEYIVLRRREGIYPEFFCYLFKALDSRKIFHGMGTGIRLTLSFKELKNMPIPLPPLPEQKAIVAYLDAETGRIDKAIAAEEKMIALLQERREIVINEAVGECCQCENVANAQSQYPIGTGNIGTGNTSTMATFACLPKGWGVKKVKQCAIIEHGSDPKTEGDIPVYGSGAESFKTCGEFKEGPTVLLGRKGATLHIPHYVEGRFWNVDTAFNVYAKPNLNLRYFYYCATCFDYKRYMSQTTLPSMTQRDYANMPIHLPPLPEQEAIVERLDRETGKIDRAIEVKRRQIELLRERRQIVIDEAVTGKVKVA